MKTEEVISLINNDVRGLKKYHLNRQDAEIKLNQNENPYDWPLQIKEKAASFFTQRPWNRYPDFIPDQLKSQLAEYAGVEAQNIIVGNGSNEMLLVLLLSFVKKTTSVTLSTPTFTVYNLLASGMGASTTSINLKENLQFDTEAICKAVEKDPGTALILCSPNNPTGSTLSKEDITGILGVHKGICILDQAYVEFGGYDAIELLKRYPNLIITRTFSKAMAGAGLRTGYMIGTAEIISEINKIKLPYNINFFSEYAASLMLQNRNLLRHSIDTTIEQRSELFDFLNSQPFDSVYPSEGNFILVRSKMKDKMFDFLVKDGILIRDVSTYTMLENCMRISIGTPEENKKLKESLRKFFLNH
ncbi:Histidinol-phosphate aminotransferase [Chitinispirillum alkaliphilum]|nr:Histidinol-phosphate aminotransferase [Chitinispirillum alkaliphilum]